MSILFSVIIPVYNAEKYLHECIESVLLQTFHSYEIILVNDCSKDSSGEICDEYCKNNSNISVIHHKKNMGRLQSRVDALHKSTGKYCLFLDADDCWHPQLLEKCAKNVELYHPGIICFQFSEHKDLLTPSAKCLPKGVYDENSIYIIKHLILKGESNNLVLKCCEKNILSQWNSFIEYGQLNYGEDWLQVLDALTYTSKCVVLNDILYWYRRNEESTTMSYSPENLRDLGIVWKKVVERANSWGDNYLDSAYFGVYANAFGYVTRTLFCLSNDHLVEEEFAKMSKILNEMKIQKPIVNGVKQNYWVFIIDNIISGRIKMVVKMNRAYVWFKKKIQK